MRNEFALDYLPQALTIELVSDLHRGALSNDVKRTLNRIAMPGSDLFMDQRFEIAQEVVAFDDDDDIAALEITREIENEVRVDARAELPQRPQHEEEVAVTAMMDDRCVINCDETLMILRASWIE